MQIFSQRKCTVSLRPKWYITVQKDNRTKILQGREYSYAPNQTELSQPNFYDYLRQYVAPQEQSGRKMVNSEKKRIDNRSISNLLKIIKI
jgi:hypothetical protein